MLDVKSLPLRRAKSRGVILKSPGLVRNGGGGSEVVVEIGDL